MNRSAVPGSIIAMVSIVMLLPGCATVASTVPNGATALMTASEDASPWKQQYVYGGDSRARWGDDNAGHIILSTYGSWGCPITPQTLEVTNSTTIAVTLAAPTGENCDSGIATIAFAAPTPPALETRETITVLVDGEPYATLPPREN